MDTSDDISIPANDWVDIYDLAGFTVGTPLYGVNKCSYPFLVKEQELKPEASDKNGIPVRGCCPVSIEAGSAGCWARAISIPSLANFTEWV